MTPGIYTYKVVAADQFILSVRDTEGTNLYQKVLNGAGHPGTLSSWDWSFNPSDGSYTALYPRAWYTYNVPEINLILKCKQISPFIPHEYQVRITLILGNRVRYSLYTSYFYFYATTACTTTFTVYISNNKINFVDEIGSSVRSRKRKGVAGVAR
jgi:hypothetical protein